MDRFLDTTLCMHDQRSWRYGSASMAVRFSHKARRYSPFFISPLLPAAPLLASGMGLFSGVTLREVKRLPSLPGLEYQSVETHSSADQGAGAHPPERRSHPQHPVV